MEDGVPRRDQQVRRLHHRRRVGARAGGDHRAAVERLGHVGIPQVIRDLDHHRPAAAVAQLR
jgi:hypothetical protein